MNDDRLRIPVESDYLQAIGMALYAFTRLEWSAVWCIEKLSPESIGPMSERTAGGIGKAFQKEVGKLGLSPDHMLCLAADEFAQLADVRNGICHAHPGTAVDGAQRLFRHGTPWTVALLEDAADKFAACDVKLNAIFYDFFGHPKA